MITLLFLRNGKTRFIAISPKIHKQIRVFLKTRGISLQAMMESVYNQFGDVSQKSIVGYLKNNSNR